MDAVFKVQLGVSVLGLVLSTTMLAAGKDPAVYLPVLTSIIGYWLPAPRRDLRAPASEASTQNSVAARPGLVTAGSGVAPDDTAASNKDNTETN